MESTNSDNKQQVILAGFWLRTGAHLIDSAILMTILAPLLSSYYGMDYWLNNAQYLGQPMHIVFNYVLPAVAVLIFWKTKSATPGKMATKVKIVDAQTLEKPSMPQFIIRYLSYVISLLPLCLGFLWVAWDKNKQGFHDKIAKTLVIKHR